MARRLNTLAKVINESSRGFSATVVPGRSNTDRKVGRLRIPGKGREGNRLIVKNKKGQVVFDHNSAEPYRTNADVESWMQEVGIE